MKRQLESQGYCVVEGFLTPDEVEKLRGETRQYPQRLKGQRSREYLINWDGPDQIQQILHAEKLSPLLDQINRSEKMLGLLHRLLGFDIALYHSKFILKGPGGSEVPWHQDFSYWYHQSKQACQLNCMVYLDDADEENGCLMVVPGSHRQGFVRHQRSVQHGAFAAKLDTVDTRDVVQLPGKAGTALFFGPFLYHASRRNATDRPRHSFTTVYTNPLIDTYREVLGSFFPLSRVKQLSGAGPMRLCPENYQRRNLWHLALDHVVDKSWDWIEITDRTFNDGSFEWLSARKDPRSVYTRFEQFPMSSPNRDDVRVRAGLLMDSVHELQGPLGLVFLDCSNHANASAALRSLRPGLREGSVLVLDNYYNFPGWEVATYRAFQDFITEEQLGFDYLGRSPQQVAIRVTGGLPCGCPELRWQPRSEGISYG